MTRIIGSLVVKNEEDRYLKDCITWMQQYVTDLFVYDDQSTDNTAQIAVELGCNVVVRKPTSVSFLEHEGRFRTDAWTAFCRRMHPREGQWVLSFDADEFLVGENAVESLENAIQRANKRRKMGVILPFPEVFKYEDGKAYVRTDGYWGKIQGPRLFPFRKDARFSKKAMGCGSEPTYVTPLRASPENFGLSMLHFGYARKEDQQAKYERYTSLLDHGHNNKHIQSIIQPPKLVEWTGPLPKLEFK